MDRAYGVISAFHKANRHSDPSRLSRRIGHEVRQALKRHSVQPRAEDGAYEARTRALRHKLMDAQHWIGGDIPAIHLMDLRASLMFILFFFHSINPRDILLNILRLGVDGAGTKARMASASGGGVYKVTWAHLSLPTLGEKLSNFLLVGVLEDENHVNSRLFIRALTEQLNSLKQYIHHVYLMSDLGFIRVLRDVGTSECPFCACCLTTVQLAVWHCEDAAISLIDGLPPIVFGLLHFLAFLVTALLVCAPPGPLAPTVLSFSTVDLAAVYDGAWDSLSIKELGRLADSDALIAEVCGKLPADIVPALLAALDMKRYWATRTMATWRAMMDAVTPPLRRYQKLSTGCHVGWHLKALHDRILPLVRTRSAPLTPSSGAGTSAGAGTGPPSAAASGAGAGSHPDPSVSTAPAASARPALTPPVLSAPPSESVSQLLRHPLRLGLDQGTEHLNQQMMQLRASHAIGDIRRLAAWRNTVHTRPGPAHALVSEGTVLIRTLWCSLRVVFSCRRSCRRTCTIF